MHEGAANLTPKGILGCVARASNRSRSRAAQRATIKPSLTRPTRPMNGRRVSLLTRWPPVAKLPRPPQSSKRAFPYLFQIPSNYIRIPANRMHADSPGSMFLQTRNMRDLHGRTRDRRLQLQGYAAGPDPVAHIVARGARWYFSALVPLCPPCSRTTRDAHWVCGTQPWRRSLEQCDPVASLEVSLVSCRRNREQRAAQRRVEPR
jgi:hypothetical protein